MLEKFAGFYVALELTLNALEFVLKLKVVEHGRSFCKENKTDSKILHLFYPEMLIKRSPFYWAFCKFFQEEIDNLLKIKQEEIKVKEEDDEPWDHIPEPEWGNC